LHFAGTTARSLACGSARQLSNRSRRLLAGEQLQQVINSLPYEPTIFFVEELGYAAIWGTGH